MVSCAAPSCEFYLQYYLPSVSRCFSHTHSLIVYVSAKTICPEPLKYSCSMILVTYKAILNLSLELIAFGFVAFSS